MRTAHALATSILLVAPALCAQDAYRTSVDAWHAQREARLAAEDGWLTLIGRDWLNPGENTLGSAPGSTVLLPEGLSLPKAGLFLVEGSTVRFKPLPGSGLLLNGKPAVEAVLKSDAEGQPDVIKAGRVSLYVIRRGDRLGIRVKDPETPARKAFHGVPRYPVDAAWRVEADFVAYDKPQERAIATVIGTTETMSAPGLLRFKVGGREVTLEPMVEDPEHPELFIIFKDGTSTHGTYPAGRFLYADMPKNGKVILDFNRAINPPCAFSMFATCPLPPKQNHLAIDVPAGEKNPGLH
ncbi:DUF1684 domain-containing protein [Geothrix sp. PMB-07]|uniref:DUF1684 domain-containing protein n=1 Tax=Geothrix sp. PMB-07 TaxID=3068640 RepID=UPI0027413DA8|nr:DUF1684 domain-containing protein [Geothrix sp. PMB-07]WLT33277.1 DUF1684 domain-containing protein [Geothrix sp. PMB-07]